jgi:hypothetical protein
MESERFEHPRALCIARQLAFAATRDAIDFNDRLAFYRDEIDDIPVDRMLPAKFSFGQTPPAQCLPQPRFSARL